MQGARTLAPVAVVGSSTVAVPAPTPSSGTGDFVAEGCSPPGSVHP